MTQSGSRGHPRSLVEQVDIGVECEAQGVVSEPALDLGGLLRRVETRRYGGRCGKLPTRRRPPRTPAPAPGWRGQAAPRPQRRTPSRSGSPSNVGPEPVGHLDRKPVDRAGCSETSTHPRRAPSHVDGGCSDGSSRIAPRRSSSAAITQLPTYRTPAENAAPPRARHPQYSNGIRDLEHLLATTGPPYPW